MVDEILWNFESEIWNIRAHCCFRDYSLSGDYRHIVVKPQDVTWETTRYDDITQPLVYGDLEKLQGNVNPTKSEGKK